MTVTTSGTKLDDLSVNSPSIAVQRGMNRVGKILLVFYALEKTLRCARLYSGQFRPGIYDTLLIFSADIVCFATTMHTFLTALQLGIPDLKTSLTQNICTKKNFDCPYPWGYFQ